MRAVFFLPHGFSRQDVTLHRASPSGPAVVPPVAIGAVSSTSTPGIFGAPPPNAVPTALEGNKALSGQLGDKVSFKKGAEEKEVWALSRRKLESLRTLGGTQGGGGGVTDKAASMNLSAYILSNQPGRRATFMVKKQQQVLLQPLELLVCKRKLSDPQIQAAMVAAEDDAVSLSAWMADASLSNVSINQPRQAVTDPRRRRQSVLSAPPPTSLKAAKLLLLQLSSELQGRMPRPETLREAFERRDARIRQEFEAARVNPLHHLENVAGTTARSRAKTMKFDAQNLISETSQTVSAPAAPQSMAAQAGLVQGKKLQTRKDCILEFDSEQERYVLKFATCDRMMTSLVDRFWEADKQKDKKLKKVRLAEVTATARQFCIGSLKLWTAAEVLDAMLRLMDDLVAHEKKMQGTEWASSTAGLPCLERLVLVWLQECFPRCVKDTSALNCFTTLVAAMPNRDAIEDEIVLLSQAKSEVFKRTVGKKNVLKRTLGLFGSASRNSDVDSNDFMRLDVLEVSSSELALELTRLSVSLMREIAVDKLVKRDLGVDPNLARGAKSYLDLPPLFVLRSRTERLSHWAASVVLGEKQLSRRVALFSKLIAVAARLVDMRNLHDAVAIITAMHNPAVSRLRQTNTAAGETVNSAFQRLTTLIRPPYQNLRRKVAVWAESTEKASAYLPSLEVRKRLCCQDIASTFAQVLLQDMAKLDEVERNFVPHPENETVMLGNIWKTNLLGSWVAKFCDGFANRFFDFEGTEPSARSVVVASLVRVLPDVWDDDTLWAMSQRLEASAL